MNTITAIAPDGSIRWHYTEPSVGQGVIAGPTVGPDGNIYVISDYRRARRVRAVARREAFSGAIRATPTFAENGQLGVEIVFGSGRLYAAFDERTQGAEHDVRPFARRDAALGDADGWQ